MHRVNLEVQLCRQSYSVRRRIISPSALNHGPPLLKSRSAAAEIIFPHALEACVELVHVVPRLQVV